MARKPTKKKTSTVSVSFKGVQSRQLLPEDDYRLKLVEAEAGESNAGNDQITWTFAVNDGGKFDGQKLWMHTPLIETALWKLHALLTALGVEVPDDDLDIDLEQMVEDELEIMGVVGHETYDGAKRSKLQDFYAIEEGDKDEPKAAGKKGTKGKKPAGVTREAVEAMDREELEELCTEHGLDADTDDFKKDAKFAEAIIEELEEKDLLIEDEPEPKGKKAAKDDDDEETPAQARARRRRERKAKATEDDDDEKPAKGKKKSADEDDEDEKPKKGKKSKSLPKLSSDEVQGMDEDELGEVIEKYGLDTDLDDYKTLRKKAAAVIDALEDGDHIDDE